MDSPLVFAHLLPPESGDFARFRREQIAYWIEGQARPDPRPRWNLLDNVLVPMLNRAE